ncbi:HD-GYP domain-containing protein [Pseudomonas sp. PH1b]|uniref:HD-GYP domain-containing protein n=1 Tax=Pseudomonas sp. PH1b TaxID=1397282 RepID=UPI00046AF971|nr:HD-GYP domain-containing protein [Pseudomonas sp. PH1b]
MLKLIKTTDLCVGMYIKELCGSWLNHPFLRGRFLLSNEQDLKQILNSSVSQVWIDISKGLDVPPDAVSLSPEEAGKQADVRLEGITEKTTVIRSSMEDELVAALRICERSKSAVVEMFSHVRMGAVIKLDGVDILVDEIARSIHRHPNALISLARLKTADEYTYLHSVAVSALMIALARQLGLSEDLVHEAGIAGLLHDIGKAVVPDAILNKPSRLDDAEFELIRRHPQAGVEILMSSHHVSALALDVCLHHHEKDDGSGYPFGLLGEQISLFARMGAVCDVYDAITSDRPYKKGWGPSESIHKMAEWQGHFDESIFKAFVRTVGIYPVGSLVRLESGALGVVIEQHERSLLMPKVKVFFMAKGRTPILPKVIDLAKSTCTDRIVGRESPEAWGFRNVEEFWKCFL